ncbi:2,4-dihydroxyhept-2-ene-1,7-dioic acid aldolase [Neohortaea acidophila]|uniref:2,4-dihydroxyhept-2-ene-1,7-dioic acid aldolase n=1 Tax=Neohortaea acidophila TaxID=245834 RepID=A0A6A6Q0D4_9PEZI|nr:2,4-dihydroxyhept-2-ene-1,7-dioic acid aldolase [Neohortaea acidophila]KAF2484877.1 2,4-dihydroxyhept-2-ene-1,7-dioic acid aldolase [Neohortaea acidophila]
MSLNTAIRRSLRDSATSFGFWQTLPSSALTRTVLRSSAAVSGGAFTWVVVDAEHGLIVDKDYYELTTAAASEGASPIVRVPWGEEWLIKRALDAGAHGIVTPMCHSPADAAKIVQYCKYPPLGSRGYGPMFSPHSFPAADPNSDYVAGAQNELMVIVQIESRPGLESVEEIARVDGIDALLIGPFDLALQTGLQRAGQEHEAAIQRILNAAHAAGKKCAIFCTDGSDARTRVVQGFDMVSVNTDVGVLGSAMSKELITARDGVSSGSGKTSGGY